MIGYMREADARLDARKRTEAGETGEGWTIVKFRNGKYGILPGVEVDYRKYYEVLTNYVKTT